MSEAMCSQTTAETLPDGASASPLLEVTDLRVHFPIRGGLFGLSKGWVRAVDGVSFTIRRGETLALVGESGCGKSTTGYAVLGMQEICGGRVCFEGQDLGGPGGWAEARRHMQIIFQDPFASLDPKMPVGESIAEPLRTRGASRDEQTRTVTELLDLVGLHPQYAARLPNQFSGGQRQRLVIARALALKPRLIVCDEPVSALDVSIRSQVLNLLMELQQRLGLAYLFISHDLSVVRHISDRVAVMYLGRIVESGDTQSVFEQTAHPYTRALLSAIPVPDPARRRQRIVLSGELPSPARPPKGCPLSTRCPHVMDVCQTMPPMQPVSPTHEAACHLLHL